MTPQCENLIARLQRGPLTYIEAKKELGIVRLSARICECRKAGHRIRQDVMPGTKGNGKKIQYARYHLEPTKKKDPRKYTCELGDRVLCQGKEIMVQEVIEKGSEKRMIRAYIKGCSIHQDGTPLVRSSVFAGQDWRHKGAE